MKLSLGMVSKHIFLYLCLPDYKYNCQIYKYSCMHKQENHIRKRFIFGDVVLEHMTKTSVFKNPDVREQGLTIVAGKIFSMIPHYIYNNN